MRSLLKKLSNRARYILAVLDGSVDLRRKTNEEVTTLLESAKYDLMEGGDYKYLTKMPMDSVTEENAEKLFSEYSEKYAEIETIRNKTIMKMWSSELEVLEQEYIIYKKERNRSCLKEGGQCKDKIKTKKTKSKK